MLPYQRLAKSLHLAPRNLAGGPSKESTIATLTIGSSTAGPVVSETAAASPSDG